jgi:hypothetical protein
MSILMSYAPPSQAAEASAAAPDERWFHVSAAVAPSLNVFQLARGFSANAAAQWDTSPEFAVGFQLTFGQYWPTLGATGAGWLLDGALRLCWGLSSRATGFRPYVATWLGAGFDALFISSDLAGGTGPVAGLEVGGAVPIGPLRWTFGARADLRLSLPWFYARTLVGLQTGLLW